MSISKIFLYDFFSKVKVKRTLLLLTLLSALFSITLSNLQFTSSYSGLIGVTIALTSTAYTLSSYITAEKLRLYISLPINSKKLIHCLVITLYADVLLERLSIFIIAALFLFQNPLTIILNVIGSAFICVVTIVSLLLSINAGKKLLFAINLIAMFGIICSSIIFSNRIMYWIIVNICIIAIPIKTLLMIESNYLITNQRIKKRTVPAIFKKNYFVLIMIAEKIFLVNTIAIIIIIISFLATFPDFPLLINLAFCMSAINTPAMTMLSGDKWISRQADMLPDVKNSISIIYLKFLIGYFSVINLIILLVISMKEGRCLLKNIAIALIAIALEVTLTIFLEKKWRITNWKTRKELWRNPRKYIVPIIVFIVTTTISSMLR